MLACLFRADVVLAAVMKNVPLLGGERGFHLVDDIARLCPRLTAWRMLRAVKRFGIGLSAIAPEKTFQMRFFFVASLLPFGLDLFGSFASKIRRRRSWGFGL
jgi:hypothetical protein